MKIGGNVNLSWVRLIPLPLGLTVTGAYTQWPILARTAMKVIIIKTSPQVKWDAGPEGFLPLIAV